LPLLSQFTATPSPNACESTHQPTSTQTSPVLANPETEESPRNFSVLSKHFAGKLPKWLKKVATRSIHPWKLPKQDNPFIGQQDLLKALQTTLEFSSQDNEHRIFCAITVIIRYLIGPTPSLLIGCKRED